LQGSSNLGELGVQGEKILKEASDKLDVREWVDVFGVMIEFSSGTF
jgi:hypothetical protein